MATTYTSRAALPKPATDDTGWDTTINAGTDRLDSYEAIGGLCVRQAEYPSATLNVNVGSGRFKKYDGTEATYAGATGVTIPASSTRYVWLDETATLQQGSAFPTTRCMPLAVVTTDGTTVTDIDDRRSCFSSVGTNALPYLPLAGGTMTDTSVVTIGLGTTNGTKVGASTSDKLGFYNATPVVRPSAYTQTYATSTKTMAAYTTNAQSSAYTGAADGEAKLADLNALRVAYENLRASSDTTKQVVNALIDDLQALGLLG